MRRIYDSPTLAVDFLPVAGAELPLFITFNSHRPTPHDALVGGWQNHITREAKNGLFFIAKQNHWFHVADIGAAVDIARGVRDEYALAVGIGASMGAHAAIRLSGRLDLSAVVAISPQVCISPERASFEKRWRKDLVSVTALDRPIEAATTSPETYVFYDGTNAPDVTHVNEIEKLARIYRVELPHSGHSSVGGIADTGSMSAIFDFTGDARRNFHVATGIIGNFWRNEGSAAAVILNKVKALPEERRAQFLAGLSGVIGMKRNRDAVSAMIEKYLPTP